MDPETTQSADSFRTTNQAQAFALTCAGFPLALVRNLYTPEMLTALAVRLRRDKITAREAWREGHRGTVDFFFQRSPSFDACVADYDEEKQRFKDGKDGTDTGLTPSQIVRIAAGILHRDRPFTEMVKKVVPHLDIQAPGDPVRKENPDGSITVTHPGRKIISIDDHEALARAGQS